MPHEEVTLCHDACAPCRVHMDVTASICAVSLSAITRKSCQCSLPFDHIATVQVADLLLAPPHSISSSCSGSSKWPWCFLSNPGQFTHFQDHLSKSLQDDLYNPSSLSMASCVEELLVSNALNRQYSIFNTTCPIVPRMPYPSRTVLFRTEKSPEHPI